MGKPSSTEREELRPCPCSVPCPAHSSYFCGCCQPGSVCCGSERAKPKGSRVSVGIAMRHRMCSAFLCLNTLQSHFCTRNVELHQGCQELGLLLCCARLRAWDGGAASHVPAGEGKMPAANREAGQRGQRPPASLRKLRWVLGYAGMVRGLVTAGAQPRSGSKAELACGISASIPSQKHEFGWRAAELWGSQQPRAGTDPAALLIAPGSPASCVTGPGRVGARAAGSAGGLWSSSSSQHLGDGD